MKQYFLRAATRALFDSDLVASRMILGTAELIWALLLFWPGDTFARPTYTLMAEVASEEVWAAAFTVMGVLQLGIVISEAFHSLFARVFAVLNALFWVFVVMSMLLSITPVPAAIGGEIALAMAAVWIFVRPYIVFRGIVHARTHTA